jgi:membrane fusion protein, multidrug efflux system
MQNSKVTQKILIICAFFSLFLVIFYFFKTTLINFFISRFTKQKPYVAAIHPQAVSFIQNYHTLGEIKAAQITELSPSIGGKVSHIFFKANQKVHKGQLLIQLEDQVELAQIKLADAEYQLQKKLHQQYQTLIKTHVISQTQFLESLAHLKKAKANLEQAQAQWELKKIRAPFSGTLGIPHVYPGQFLTPGQKDLVQIVKLTPLYVDFHLPEHYYSKIHLQEKIQFGHDLTATIIAIEPLSKKMAHTIDIRAKIDNPHYSYLPGQFVKLKIPVSAKQELFSIPSSALVNSSKGSSIYIAQHSQTHKNYQVKQQDIQIRHHRGNQILFSANISDKDWIVHAGTQKISNGQFIHLQKDV